MLYVQFVLFLLTFGLVLMDAKEQKNEQRVALKFLVQSGKCPCDCLRALRPVFGDRTMSETQVQFWHKRFSQGDMNTSTKDKARPGRPCSSRTPGNIQSVRQLLQEDRRCCVRELACEANLSETVTFNILRKDLEVRKRAARLVPTSLSDTQKEVRAQLCDENLTRWRRDLDHFLSRIIMCDETWLSTFEPETKRQSSVWLNKGDPRPQHPRRANNARKTMMTVFFDKQGVILAEFLEPKGTVNSEHFIVTLAKMKEAVHRKRPKLWAIGNTGHHHFILQMDNASPHTAAPTALKLEQWKVQVLAHPPNSPDLAPCDFALFPKLKESLRGIQFRNIEELQKAAIQVLRRMPKQFFFQAISDLTIRWKKCQLAQGAYFEGAYIQVDIETIQVGESSDSEED